MAAFVFLCEKCITMILLMSLTLLWFFHFSVLLQNDEIPGLEWCLPSFWGVFWLRLRLWLWLRIWRWLWRWLPNWNWGWLQTSNWFFLQLSAFACRWPGLGARWTRTEFYHIKERVSHLDTSQCIQYILCTTVQWLILAQKVL